MGFWAASFIFDGTPSSMYNLYINSPDSGNFEQNPTPSDVEIFTERIFRRPKVYFYGTSPSPVLEFDVTFTSPYEIDSITSQAIQRWLFGHNEYKKLQIVQNDMLGVYYNCFLTSPQVLKSGRTIVGYKAKVVCDSPYAWEFEKSFTREYTDPVISETYSFYNDSDHNGYMYPRVDAVINSTGGDISITNLDDSSRVFEFLGLSPLEALTVENDYGIITSSTGLNRLSLFNKKWLRLVPGLNRLHIKGNIEELTVTYELARKVGT